MTVSGRRTEKPPSRVFALFLETKEKNSEGDQTMATNRKLASESKETLNKFKMEAAQDVGVNLKQGYNGDLTSKEAGSIGGQMVKKMIQSYEKNKK